MTVVLPLQWWPDFFCVLMPRHPLHVSGTPAPVDVSCAASADVLRQASHVYLAGNQLPQRWRTVHRFTILQPHFGTGLAFLVAWKAWREDADRAQRLHYLAIESHPSSADEMARLHAQWPELADVAAELRANWPPRVAGFNRLLLDEGRVVLTLVFGDVAQCLPQIKGAIDAFFLDGPEQDGGLTSALLARLHRLAAPHATAAAPVFNTTLSSALTQAGFSCRSQQGMTGEPAMLAAQFAPRRPIAQTSLPALRQVIVLGAGIAGSAACERFADRGWEVTLIDRHPAPAQEASGNLAAIAMPLLSRDDNLASRLSRAAFLFSLQIWRRLGGIGKAFTGSDCGVLQLARDDGHARLQRETLSAHRFPSDFVRWLDPQAMSMLTGRAGFGGWLFPAGGWLRPSSLCDALLAACGDRLTRKLTHEAVSLRRNRDTWEIEDALGNKLAQAPVVVIANGAGAMSFPVTRDLPLSAIRGQVTHLPADALPPVPMVLCGDGYLTPPFDGISCVGASYDFDNDPALRESSHIENLARLAQVLPQLHEGGAHWRTESGNALAPGVGLPGRVGFRCVSPDRLPLVGSLPDASASITGSRLRDVPRLPGIYGLLAYGSRGVIWSSFAAELLVSMIEGDPLPVENELADALDPARFALKAWRRNS